MNIHSPKQLELLLAKCALGDQLAFKQLYDATAGKLNGIAYRILNQTDNANEVLQEAFIQIWNNAGQYRSELAEPMTWMACIVRYRAYDRIKFEKRRIEGSQIRIDLNDFESIDDSTSSSPPMCEMGKQLENCLQSLEQFQQRAILMAYYYGSSRAEIADHFETPISTVKSWLRRGLVRLQQCLRS